MLLLDNQKPRQFWDIPWYLIPEFWNGCCRHFSKILWSTINFWWDTEADFLGLIVDWWKPIWYILRIIICCFNVFYCGLNIDWLYPNTSGLLHWHWHDHTFFADSEATLGNRDKYTLCIHKGWIYNHYKTNQHKTMPIFEMYSKCAK